MVAYCSAATEPPPTGVPNRFPTARCLKAFCGCSVVARAGKICLSNTPRPDVLASAARLEADGIWLKAWRALLRQLDAQGQLDWAETFADGSFAPAKKGGIVSAKPPVERVRSGWWWSTAKVFLWETTWTRRPVHTLIEPTLERVAIPRPGRGRPRTRLIYDKAGDSDPLRTRLARRGKLICPQKIESNRRRKMDDHCVQETMDERTFSWWGNFRR